MAKPSKRRPWVLELEPEALPTQWFNVDAFPDEELARAYLGVVRRRDANARWRIRNVVTNEVIEA